VLKELLQATKKVVRGDLCERVRQPRLVNDLQKNGVRMEEIPLTSPLAGKEIAEASAVLLDVTDAQTRKKRVGGGIPATALMTGC